MDDEAGDTAREAVGEFPHQRAVPPVQHVDAPAQVDDGQARMGRHEPQDMLELIWRVGVDLGGRAHLGEAEPGEPEQRLIPVDALLEQGVNATRCLAENLVRSMTFNSTVCRRSSHHGIPARAGPD